jgi:hypothetical protein
MAALTAHAIEAPHTNTPPSPASAPPTVPSLESTSPSPETRAFYLQLQRVTQRQRFHDLGIGEPTLELLARGQIAAAVSRLEQEAAAGDAAPDIALIRIQRECAQKAASPPEETYLAQRRAIEEQLPPARQAKALQVQEAGRQYDRQLREACSAASFDYGAIENRLRRAAAAGEVRSLTELSRFTGDPEKRLALLSAATAKGYAPAQYAQAVQWVYAAQRGEETKHVAAIRPLLKQAGQSLPSAKLDLANCVATGCDGYPADTPTAAIFGLDAARDGVADAFAAMLSLPWGSRLPPEQLLAWQYFGDALNEAGCMGDAYLKYALRLAQAIRRMEQPSGTGKSGPGLGAAAQKKADEFSGQYLARAQREQFCAE